MSCTTDNFPILPHPLNIFRKVNLVKIKSLWKTKETMLFGWPEALVNKQLIQEAQSF